MIVLRIRCVVTALATLHYEQPEVFTRELLKFLASDAPPTSHAGR